MSIIVEFAKLNVQININEHKTNEPGETSPINIYAETEHDYYRYFSLPVPTPFSTFKKFMAFNERNPPMIIYDNEKIIVQYICEIFDVDIRLELSKDTIDDITIEKRKYLILEDKYKELNTKYEDLNKEIDAIKKYLIEAKSENKKLMKHIKETQIEFNKKINIQVDAIKKDLIEAEHENKTYKVYIFNNGNFLFENKEHELILLNYCKKNKDTIFANWITYKLATNIDKMQSLKEINRYLCDYWNNHYFGTSIIYKILWDCNFIIQSGTVNSYVVNKQHYSFDLTYIIPKNTIYKNYKFYPNMSILNLLARNMLNDDNDDNYIQPFNNMIKQNKFNYIEIIIHNILFNGQQTLDKETIIYECE